MISFESVDTINKGNAIGQWRTHPAFWWDNNSNDTREAGEEIKGFWAGKFEMAQGTSTTAGTGNPVVLDNVSSWVQQTVRAQFETVLKFAGGTFNSSSGAVTFAGSSLYGLSANTDSHMMKNREWAAIAYLSHSAYGLNGQIRINNYYKSSKYLTGCGAASDNASNSTTCSIVYGAASSYPQSSSGNISGVFDMSGGAWDRLMANYNKTAKSSNLSTFPDKKYYDLFTISSLSSCTYDICAGHALTETYTWYDDLMNYPNGNYPWFVRNGGYNETSETGAFNLGRNVGGSSALSSTRAVLIVK